MANRLIRDEMLESERVLSLPVEARWLFVTILLSADDLGFFEATIFKLARKADVRREMGEKLMTMIADADLVRLYEVAGKRYGFVPRFRQRVQIRRLKYPLPPKALYEDDPDALSKINNLAFNPTDEQLLDNGCASAAQPSEAEVEAEEEIHPSVPAEPTDVVGTAAPYRPPACPTAEIVALYHRALPELPAVEVLNDGRKRSVSARWREVCADGKLSRQQALEWFAWFFGHVATSDFLMGRVAGRSGRVWRASFDFLMTPAKFTRIVEGAYHQGGATV